MKEEGIISLALKRGSETVLNAALAAMVVAIMLHLDEWTAIARDVVAALKSTAY